MRRPDEITRSATKVSGPSATLEAGDDRAAVSAEVAERKIGRVPARVRTRRLESRLARAERRLAQWSSWSGRLRASPLYRLLVKCGVWRWREAEAVALAAPDAVDWDLFPPPLRAERLELRSCRPARQGAVAVDLASLLPGAENGGAKALALAVVAELARARPQQQFLVLVDPACARELAGLERENVELIEVSVREERALERLLDERAVKVLLCPMTAPSWSDPRLPQVCVVHDLQHRYLPWFFDDVERDARDLTLERVAWTADEVISVSSSTRDHLIESTDIPAGRITVVHNRISDRLPEADGEEVDRELAGLGLEAGGFVIYPANFWPHKNHQTLLHGFALFCALHEDSGLRLVLTGAQRPDPAPVLEAARRLGLEDRVRFLGFVDERQLAALYRGGRALVFPSLFEGFGMPLLEAMANGLPVFASRLDVHREVAQEAAELFEPRAPEAVCSVFERIESDPDLLERLRRAGRRQARRLGGVRAMGEDYWRVLERAASRPHRGPEVYGRYADGWTAERFLITHVAPCELVLELCNPLQQAVTVELGGANRVWKAAVPAGKAVRLHCDLTAGGGWIEARVRPAFRPGNGDSRHLGVMMRRCFECLEGGVVLDLLAEAR